MKRLLLLVVLAIAGLHRSGAVAQSDPAMDSLRGIWSDTHRADSARFDALYRAVNTSPAPLSADSAFKAARTLAAFARLHGLDTRLGKCLVMEGIRYSTVGMSDSSERCYNEAIKIFERTRSLRNLGYALNNLGNSNSERGDDAHAIANLTRSLRLAEEVKDSGLIARTLGNIGTIYDAQGDRTNALDYYQRRLAIATRVGAKDMMGEALNNIGTIHQHNKQYDLAVRDYEAALSLALETGYYQLEVDCLQNLAAAKDERGDHDAAIALSQQAIAKSEAIHDIGSAAASYVAIGNIGFAKGDLSQALTGGEHGLALAQEAKVTSVTRDAANLLYQVRKARGDERGALAMHELYIAMRDSVTKDENKQAIMQQRFQYDYDKKEALLNAEQEKKDAVAAEEIRRRNLQRNAFIGGFSLMLLLAVVFFVQRNRINKEKQRSDDLLLNILPAEVAEELKAKGEADAKQIDQVTVLFTDFKGFTAMSEQLTPKELVRDIHECFSAFDRICEKHGIEKIKTIGDAYMAAGGLPTPNSTHAVDVVHAALGIVDFIAEGKARKVAVGLPYFEIRIGVHTGPVVAGIVGVKKFAYDIWGDTVNTASRMESSGEVGEVNISEASYALVRNTTDLSFTPRGKVRAKGKGELEMYFVRRASERA